MGTVPRRPFAIFLFLSWTSYSKQESQHVSVFHDGILDAKSCLHAMRFALVLTPVKQSMFCNQLMNQAQDIDKSNWTIPWDLLCFECNWFCRHESCRVGNVSLRVFLG